MHAAQLGEAGQNATA